MDALQSNVVYRPHGATEQVPGLTGEESFRSLLDQPSMRVESERSCGRRQKRKSSQRHDYEYDYNKCGDSPVRCKRFASEELVTAHLQQLNLTTPPHTSSCPPDNISSLRDPPWNSPPNHHLLITALSDCPGLGHMTTSQSHVTKDLNHVTRDAFLNTVSADQLPQQCTYVCEHTGQRDVQLIARTSPLRLIDDTSTQSHASNSWACTGGEEVCPPLYPVRAQPGFNPGQSGLTGLSRTGNSFFDHQYSCVPISSDVKIKVTSASSPTNQIADVADIEECMNVVPGATSRNIDDLNNVHETMGRPYSLPVSKMAWRQLDVTLDEVSSDSSDGGIDGPERPISMWISPELIHYSTTAQNTLPQSLLEKFNKPAGMELVPWVDPNTRLKAGCENINKSEEEMTEEDFVTAESDENKSMDLDYSEMDS